MELFQIDMLSYSLLEPFLSTRLQFCFSCLLLVASSPLPSTLGSFDIVIFQFFDQVLHVFPGVGDLVAHPSFISVLILWFVVGSFSLLVDACSSSNHFQWPLHFVHEVVCLTHPLDFSRFADFSWVLSIAFYAQDLDGPVFHFDLLSIHWQKLGDLIVKTHFDWVGTFTDQLCVLCLVRSRSFLSAFGQSMIFTSLDCSHIQWFSQWNHLVLNILFFHFWCTGIFV